eukprot:GHVP01069427.1.p1 GENE.GHVP01069427.1~~GHVP01069427.1.p1  ORF type:complete len:236 (+),score=42.45 GHVP01069427.1:307-1014(+)
MGTRNSPALFSEFVGKTLNDLMLQFPDNIRFYQDDVAVGASSPEDTIKIATLAANLLRLAGLIENQEKSFWNPVETKPLLGSIWSPNKISQKPEAIQKLQDLHQKWRGPTPESQFSTPTNQTSIAELREILEKQQLEVQLEQLSLEKRKLLMASFRFSNDNNYHLDEARHQLEVLYPNHSKEELIPLIQKVSVALGAKDFSQARKIMSQWKKKYDYNRNASPPKKNSHFQSGKKA